MASIFVFVQNSYFEILIPSVMVLADGMFGRYLRNEDGALINGTSALLKENPENSLATSIM